MYYNRCKQAEHVHTASLTRLLAFFDQRGMYFHLVLVYLAIEVELTCENAAKKETKFDVVNMAITITVYKSSLQDFYLVSVYMTGYANARQASNIFMSN